MLVQVMIVAYIFVFSVLTGGGLDSAQLKSFADLMAVWGLLILNSLLTVPAAAWVARRVGAEATLHGVLVGLVSVAVIQLIDLPNGAPDFNDLTKMFILSVGAGWLGGSLADATLRGQKALYRASQAINAARSPQEIVSAIGQHLADPAEVSQVALWQEISEVEDDTSMDLELLAAWAPRKAQAWESGLRLNSALAPALSGLQDQQTPLLLRASELPASERTMWERQGIRWATLLPLITSNDTLAGTLMVASRRTGGFSRSTMRRYLTVSAQAALALENLRLVEQERQAGVLRERQRLAHEIHDTLAQGFTSIVMSVQIAEGTLAPDLTAPVRQLLDQVRLTARESLAEARRLMWALRPEALEHSSLPEALSSLAERWSGDCEVAASSTIIGTARSLSPDIEFALLRVAQEALANCRKYAQASQVVMTLSYMSNLVTLEVKDDGVGFDPAQPPTKRSELSGGFGLKGMRERVEQLSGTLLVESVPGEGTTLMVELPVVRGQRSAGGMEDVKAAP
ncbi:MAG: sensor histidine kinase [Rubrobacter sp.]|nr:sensor histidine kinase [Rubrobacter sp.]